MMTPRPAATTVARVDRYSGLGTSIGGTRFIRGTPESIAIYEASLIARQPPGAFTMVRINDEEWVTDENGSRQVDV